MEFWPFIAIVFGSVLSFGLERLLKPAVAPKIANYIVAFDYDSLRSKLASRVLAYYRSIFGDLPSTLPFWLRTAALYLVFLGLAFAFGAISGDPDSSWYSLQKGDALSKFLVLVAITIFFPFFCPCVSRKFRIISSNALSVKLEYPVTSLIPSSLTLR